MPDQFVEVETSGTDEPRSLASFAFRREIWVENTASDRLMEVFDHLRRSRRWSRAGAASGFGKTATICEYARRNPVVTTDGRTSAPVVHAIAPQEGWSSRLSLVRGLLEPLGVSPIGRRNVVSGLQGELVHLLSRGETELLIIDEGQGIGRILALELKKIVEEVQNSLWDSDEARRSHRRPMGVVLVCTITDERSIPTEASGLRPYEYEQFARRMDPALARVAVPALSLHELRPVVKALEQRHREAFPSLRLARWSPVLHERLLAEDFRPIFTTVTISDALDLVERVLQYLWVSGIDDLETDNLGEAIIELAAAHLADVRNRERLAQDPKQRTSVTPSVFMGAADAERTMRQQVVESLGAMRRRKAPARLRVTG